MENTILSSQSTDAHSSENELLKETIARLQAENEALRQSQSSVSKETLKMASKEYGQAWYQKHTQGTPHESGVRPLPMQYRLIEEDLEPFMTDECRTLTLESGLLAVTLGIMEKWNAVHGDSSPASIFRVARICAGEEVTAVAKEAVAKGFDDFDNLVKSPANELGRFFDINKPTCYVFFSNSSGMMKRSGDGMSDEHLRQIFLRIRTQFSFKKDWNSFVRRCADGDFSGSSALMTRYNDHQMPDIGGATSWPLLLIEEDGSRTLCFMFHANIFHHYCPLMRSWAVRDLMFLKNGPLSKVLVDPKSGILIWQNPASCSLIGAHSLENCQPSPGQKGRKSGLNFLALLFEGQEELKQEMLALVKTGASFNQRMEIKSFELKRMLGFSPLQPLWHKVFASQIQDPLTHNPSLIIVQVDETAVVVAEMKVKTLQTQQQALLQEILPQQVTDILLLRLSRVNESIQKGSESGKWVSDTSEPLERLSVRSGSSGVPGLSRQNVQDLSTSHDDVTILFADIKGFTSMSAALHPRQVMLLLNDLFHKFDDLLETYDVYKVETIGDCYVVAAGLFDRMDESMTVEECMQRRKGHPLGHASPFPCRRRDGGWGKLGGRDPHHAPKMLQFALALAEAAAEVENPLDGGRVEVRIGIHSGPVYSGVVGRKMPRFCLFGDTINTASRMESTGEAGRIHVSSSTASLLEGVAWEERTIQVKGKGEMKTFFYPGGLQAVGSLIEVGSPFWSVGGESDRDLQRV